MSFKERRRTKTDHISSHLSTCAQISLNRSCRPNIVFKLIIALHCDLDSWLFSSHSNNTDPLSSDLMELTFTTTRKKGIVRSPSPCNV